MPTIENLIAAEMVTALKAVLGLSDIQCYPTMAPAFVQGQDKLVIQVCPGAVTTEYGGKGGQEGGPLFRMQQFHVCMWYKVKLDVHGRSSIALQKETSGFLDRLEAIRSVFRYTYLNQLTTEPLWYIGETDTEWYDEDEGVGRREVTYSAMFGEPFPGNFTWPLTVS